MRKTMIAVATIFVSLAAVQLIASAGAGAASAPMRRTTDLRFTEGLCSDQGAHCKVVGDQKDPNAFGNQLVFAIPLSSGGKRIGFEQGDCVNLHKASGSIFCTYNLFLPEGSVSVQGTLPITSRTSAPIPVTGGTRGYLGAYGTLKLIAGTFDYRLHIVTP